ncbi:MAG: prepilin peptidase [Syntrophomonadaceae bacterium]|jgi:leader peptidase (prepilin peptidase)/N-methyltransferase
MIYLGVIALGLVMGSFLNVIIHRLPYGESIISPCSHCPECSHPLKTLDLVPLFSYLWLRGRCRYCKKSISLGYPLVEALTAVAFLAIYSEHGLSLIAISGWLFSMLVIAAAMIDIYTGIIPDKITFPGIAAGLVMSYFTVGVPGAVLGAVFFGGVLFLIAVISRGGMGGGDVKLALLIGAFTGMPGAFLALVISSLTGGAYALGLLILKQATLKTAVRFGPFLALGGWLALLKVI